MHFAKHITVTFDLELSGIHKTTGGKTALNRKQRAEERYVEIKEAAERFQVLQFGLCAVSFDDERGEITLIAPLIEIGCLWTTIDL